MNLLRIVCYAALLSLISLPAFAEEEAEVSDDGKWLFMERIDPFTDKDSSFVVHMANEGRNSGLLFRCNGERAEIAIRFQTFIASARTRTRYPVAYRFLDPKGNQPALNALWSLSTKGDALFVNTDLVQEFAQYVVDYERLVVQVRDFNGTPVNLDLDLSGESGYINRLACFSTETEDVETEDVQESASITVNKVVALAKEEASKAFVTASE